MQQSQQPKKRLPDWLASFLLIVSVCMVFNILFIFLQLGAFNFWKSLPRLPSPITQIVDADPFRVWIKTADNRIFTAHITCESDRDCRKWVLIKESEEINAIQAGQTRRKSTCRDFDRQFLKNPWGKVVECIETEQPPMPEGGRLNTYYVLMSNGSVKYRQFFGGHFLTPILLGGLATFICTPIVFVIISSVYLERKVSQAG